MGFVLVNGTPIDVPGVDIDHDRFSFEKSGGKFGKRKGLDGVRSLAILHWDVCPSAESCFRVLLKGGLSSTFGVDNDGKVYQWLDPGRHFGYSAGIGKAEIIAAKADGRDKANSQAFVSFDLTNLVELKHTGKYKPPRPLISAAPHGDRKAFMGMRACQILSTLRILKALSKVYAPKLSLKFPAGPDGKPIERTVTAVPTLGGVYSHLHVSKNKWDVAGFEAQVIAMLLLDAALRAEFPELVDNFKLDDPAWKIWLNNIRQQWTWPEILV